MKKRCILYFRNTLISNTCSFQLLLWYTPQCKDYNKDVICWGQIIHMVASWKKTKLASEVKRKQHKGILSLLLSVVMTIENQSRYIFIFTLLNNKAQPLSFIIHEKTLQSSSLLFSASLSPAMNSILSGWLGL